MNVKIWAWLRFIIPILLTIIAFIIIVITNDQYDTTPIVFLLVTGGIYKVLDFAFWKCPHCNSFIGKGRLKICRNCDENVFE